MVTGPLDKKASDFSGSKSPLLGTDLEEKETTNVQILDLDNNVPQDEAQPQVTPSLPTDDETLTATVQEDTVLLNQPVPVVNSPQAEVKIQAGLWRDKVKPRSGSLDPEGTPFTLASGEACVRIPNAVIEKNKKSWDNFIIGQFYEEAPARGAVHAIVNGMWSKQRRDIAVSKMEGNAFLFRVPCPNARKRILGQCLWQVDGQTMFVAKWSPGFTPEKPSLATVPVWLDFTGVPLQFFNRDALKEIAGLVGHPLYVHPATENLTNIEVAKVYTVIDPRKPLPEAVNAQFESGAITRILVSSPWLPSLCSHCRKVGHTISKCPSAPPKCKCCNSVKHALEACPRYESEKRKGKAPIPSQFPITTGPSHVHRQIHDADNRKTGVKPAVKTAVKTPAKALKKTTALWIRSDTSQHRETADPPLVSDPQPAQKEKRAPPLSRSQTPTYDKERFCVDLRASLFEGTSKDSGSKSSDPTSSGSETVSEGFSNDDDNPDEDNDRYITVISNRKKKLLKAADRARGPLNL